MHESPGQLLAPAMINRLPHRGQRNRINKIHKKAQKPHINKKNIMMAIFIIRYIAVSLWDENPIEAK
jgi:hypothetical protein